MEQQRKEIDFGLEFVTTSSKVRSTLVQQAALFENETPSSTLQQHLECYTRCCSASERGWAKCAPSVYRAVNSKHDEGKFQGRETGEVAGAAACRSSRVVRTPWDLRLSIFMWAFLYWGGYPEKPTGYLGSDLPPSADKVSLVNTSWFTTTREKCAAHSVPEPATRTEEAGKPKRQSKYASSAPLSMKTPANGAKMDNKTAQTGRIRFCWKMPPVRQDWWCWDVVVADVNGGSLLNWTVSLHFWYGVAFALICLQICPGNVQSDDFRNVYCKPFRVGGAL